jgi:hypothetical protein
MHPTNQSHYASSLVQAQAVKEAVVDAVLRRVMKAEQSTMQKLREEYMRRNEYTRRKNKRENITRIFYCRLFWMLYCLFPENEANLI